MIPTFHAIGANPNDLIWVSELFQELPGIKSVTGARILLLLGDSVTTDHISPAGTIARNSSAARYLASRGYVTLISLDGTLVSLF